MTTPEKWMERALVLAKKGMGKTSPNPMVGAVFVKDGKIVGEGFHRQAGLPHAEIEALKKAKEKAKGATLYVNLEPCCHYGKTPPCTSALIEAGVAKVVAAMLDPNPNVNGKGLQALRDAGIEVEVGLLKKKAQKLNECFITWMTKGRPFITLKYAMTLDGKIATSTGDSKWITSEKSRQKVHEIRSVHDAILVGINTVLSDNPLLTSRIPNAKNPIRIVLDTHLRIPLDSNLLQTVSESPVWIIGGEENLQKKESLEKKGASVLFFPDKNGKEKVSLQKLCAYLGANAISSLLVEGGAKVHGAFLSEKLVDKMAVFIAPKLIGNHDAKSPIENWGKAFLKEAVRLHDVEMTPLGDDVLIEGYPKIE
jgi:diaminohydroxyphosphoribosylaminopyrimidine deaminase/5-amino-6-(5-phosphoribosylamino)uracil reductase